MNKTALIAIVMLIVGGFLGFFMSTDKKDVIDSHYMPDGTMMADEEMMDHSMSMDQMMEDMNAALVGKTGRDFDMVFVDQMIIHHQGAVEMAELALTNGDKQEIKDLANEIIKAQTKEIELMNSWRAAW